MRENIDVSAFSYSRRINYVTSIFYVLFFLDLYSALCPLSSSRVAFVAAQQLGIEESVGNTHGICMPMMLSVRVFIYLSIACFI